MKKLKIIFIILVSVFIICVIYFYFSANKLVIKDANVYSVVGGSANVYTGTVTLKHDKDNKSEISANDSHLILDATPIYFKDQKKVLFPQNMEIVFYNEKNKMFKLNYYATIEQKDNMMAIMDKNYKASKSDFFLFDGSDTYVFFEKTKIVYGNANVVIPPFSYITNIYNNKLIIYNYENGKYNEFPIRGKKVFAVMENNNEIDLNTDTLKTNDQQQLLLIKQIADLKNIE